MIQRINFFFFDFKPTLRERTRLKRFIISIFKKENTLLESISFIFTNDNAVRQINKKYLNHNYFTDIITFDLSNANSPKIAEIYISVNRVKENARFLGSSFREELHRVIFHGILHLCGYKDKTIAQIRKMRSKEDYYLEKYLGSVSRDTFSKLFKPDLKG